MKFTNPHGPLALAVKNRSSTERVMTLGSATALAQRGGVGNAAQDGILPHKTGFNESECLCGSLAPLEKRPGIGKTGPND